MTASCGDRYIFLFSRSKGMKNNTIGAKSALHITRRRTIAIGLAMAIFALYLAANLLRLQIGKYAYYKDKVFDQITTTSTLRAKRGSIYDSDMNLLATHSITWRVFLSTKQIKAAIKASGTPYDTIISEGLASLLSLDKDAILKKIQNTSVLDVTAKKAVSETEYRAVIDWIEKESLSDLVFTEAQYSRDYPEGTLAAHLLGFVGSDNQGLYGLEYQYEKLLRGEDGYYLYAKDAAGNELPIEYATYVPPKDGYSLVTTIDSYIQDGWSIRSNAFASTTTLKTAFVASLWTRARARSLPWRPPPPLIPPTPTRWMRFRKQSSFPPATQAEAPNTRPIKRI